MFCQNHETGHMTFRKEVKVMCDANLKVFLSHIFDLTYLGNIFTKFGEILRGSCILLVDLIGILKLDQDI